MVGRRFIFSLVFESGIFGINNENDRLLFEDYFPCLSLWISLLMAWFALLTSRSLLLYFVKYAKFST